MRTASLPKSRLLSRPWQYRKVYARGKRLRGPGFSLLLLGNDLGHARLGISVHGVRPAVRRNRIKRIIREFFRRHPELFGPSYDVVFAVRAEFAPDSPAEVEAAVRNVLAGAERNGMRTAPGSRGDGVSAPASASAPAGCR